ncbi:MAG: LpxD N-terminal domain-containing protein, partial [Bradyrhizobium sp.]
MSEPVFQRHTRGLTLAEIAALAGAELPDGAAARSIGNIASLDRAGPSDLAFLDNARFADAAARTHAGACLTTAVLAQGLPARVA